MLVQRFRSIWVNRKMANYWIKTFGADKSTLRFHRLPTAVVQARENFAGEQVVGYLICALIRPPRLTGLLFCDDTNDYPDGLPIHTAPMATCYQEGNCSMVIVEGGDRYVVAHWLHENGEVDRFDRVH